MKKVTILKKILFLLSIFPISVLAVETPGPVIILFDLSYSMTKPISGKSGPPKIDLARSAFRKTITDNPLFLNLALMTFGNGTTADKFLDCQKITLLHSFGEQNREQLKNALQKEKPNGRETPLTYALDQAVEEIEKYGKNAKIILISDGEETCGADPEKLAEKLSAKGISIDTIGIGSPGSFAQLGAIALAGGGTFRLAQNESDLLEALKQGAGVSQELSFSGTSNKKISTGPGAIHKAMNPDTSEMTKVLPVDLEPQIIIPEPVVKNSKPSGPVVTLELILDASGSMMGEVGGKKKIDIAKDALKQSITKIDPVLVQTGFRAYGFDSSLEKTETASCPNTELLIDFGSQNTDRILNIAQNLDAYGYTPIAESLRLAGEDLKPFHNTHRTITLISDGKETCGGDPVAVLKTLQEAGIDVQVHVIGFDINAEARKQLKAIARAGNGQYFDATDADGLVRSLNVILDQVQEKAEDLAPDRIVNPVSGGDSLETATRISPGSYTLNQHLDPGQRKYFFVQSAKAQRVVFVGFSQAQKVIESAEGKIVESSYATAGFKIEVFDPEVLQKTKEKPVRSVLVSGKIGSHSLTHYFDHEGKGVYFAITAGLDRVNKDALFKIDLQEAGDLFHGQEAPEQKEEEPLKISRGEPLIAHLGLEDRSDRYQVNNIPSGSTLQLRVKFSHQVRSRRVGIKPKLEAFRFRVEVYSQDGKRIERSPGLSGDASLNIPIPEGIDSIVLRIEDINPQLLNMFSFYEIEISTH